MKGSSSEARMKYLSLALFAQRTTRALIDFVRNGDEEPMRKSLKEALTSLMQLSHGETSNVRSFMYYEQVKTLHDMNKAPEEIIALLRSLLDRKGTQRQQHANAEKAIEFFHELEKQALLNCERPQEEIPRGIRQLCQTR